jgi:type II secretory pathway pseudopilin PulG
MNCQVQWNLESNMHRKRGLTITEIAISTAVIGTATVVAVPKFMHATHRAKEAALKLELRNFRKAVDQFYIDTGGYPDEVKDLLRESPPRSFWLKAKERAWNKSVEWHGPYMAYGEGQLIEPKDPVSDLPFLTKRADTGRLQIFSSATGMDTEGKPFTSY